MESQYDFMRERLFEIHRMLFRFGNALAQALSLSVSAVVAPENPAPQFGGGDPETSRVAIPGETFQVRVIASAQAPVRLDSLIVSRGEQIGGAQPGVLTANQPVEGRFWDACSIPHEHPSRSERYLCNIRATKAAQS